MSNHPNLILKQLLLGHMDNFVYLVGDREQRRVVVIDPAWNAPVILAAAAELGCEISAIWLTHGHYDHANAVTEILAAADVPVYFSRHMPEKWRPDAPRVIEIRDGDRLAAGKVYFDVLHTPGHSPGGTCYLHGETLIAGDTLFIDGCGRCDLPDSDVNAMYDSIHRLMALPDETVIYPGHHYGPRRSDTLANQKRTNPYMLAPTRTAFIYARLG